MSAREFLERDDIPPSELDEAPLVDPEMVHNLLLDGLVVTRNSAGGMRVVGWQAISDERGELIERRVVLRFTMAVGAVAQAKADLRRLFGDVLAPH